MKSMLLTLCSFVWLSLTAQITVNNSVFPNVGDTIRIALDTNAQVTLQANGGPKNWAFTQVMRHLRDTEIYLAASTGKNFSSFPGANVMTLGDAGAETYYKRTATEFAVLGYAGADPAGFGIDVIARFDPPLVLQRSPLQFFDVKQSTANLTIALSLKDIPDSIFTFPIPGIDSIRVRFTSKQLDIVDGYGEMKIPGQTEAVLRQKRTETTETGLDIKSFLGWTAIPTSQVPFGDFGSDTTITYQFFANNVKGPFATVQLDDDQVTPWRVRFKDNMTVAVKPVLDDAGTASINAFPNPAIDEVFFECRNLPSGQYTLKFYNLLGKMLWSHEYQISGSKSIRVDLNNMRKGTYLYNLSDSSGVNIGTKRLVIIKP
jgi:Secretion system C-terminal sorting domain